MRPSYTARSYIVRTYVLTQRHPFKQLDIAAYRRRARRELKDAA